MTISLPFPCVGSVNRVGSIALGPVAVIPVPGGRLFAETPLFFATAFEGAIADVLS